MRRGAMGKDEQWDLKVSPARHLLRRHQGTHVDLARRLVTADLNKTHQRRIALLTLSLIAFNVLCDVNMIGRSSVLVPVLAEQISYVVEVIPELAAGTLRHVMVVGRVGRRFIVCVLGVRIRPIGQQQFHHVQ